MVTEEQLRRLPLRAIVAFAARCARRVQPLYRVPDDRRRKAVERAIAVAEQFSAAWSDDVYDSDVSDRAANAALDAAMAANAGDKHNAAAAAIDAAAAAMSAARADRVAHAATDAVAAAKAAATDAAAAAWLASPAAVEIVAARADAAKAAAYVDYLKLLQLRLGDPLNIGQPVDASESGPLGPYWPGGVPDWLRAEAARTPERQEPEPPPLPRVPSLDLLIVWDPAVVGKERYAKLVTLLGDLARAEGGLGVERIRSLGVGIPERAGVPR